MAQAFIINAPKGKRASWSKDWTGAHTHVGTVRAHKRHVNPKRARRKLSSVARAARSVKRATRRAKRRFSPAQIAAQQAFTKMVRQRAAGTRKARRSSVTANSSRRTGGSMARRKRRRSAAGTPTRRRRRRRAITANPRRRVRRTRRRAYAANPRHTVRRRRRTHRRNPGFSSRGMLGSVMQGAKDGLTVTLGSGVTNLVAQRIPFGQTSTVGKAAVQLLVGTLLAPLVRKVTRSERTASFFLAGAYSNVARQLLAPVPYIGPAVTQLGLYNRGVGVYPRAAGVGVYPRAGLAGWAAAPAGAPLVANRYATANAGQDTSMVAVSAMNTNGII